MKEQILKDIQDIVGLRTLNDKQKIEFIKKVCETKVEEKLEFIEDKPVLKRKNKKTRKNLTQEELNIITMLLAKHRNKSKEKKIKIIASEIDRTYEAVRVLFSKIRTKHKDLKKFDTENLIKELQNKKITKRKKILQTELDFVKKELRQGNIPTKIAKALNEDVDRVYYIIRLLKKETKKEKNVEVGQSTSMTKKFSFFG